MLVRATHGMLQSDAEILSMLLSAKTDLNVPFVFDGGELCSEPSNYNNVQKYKVLVDHVLHAWAYYNQHILNGNYQLWKEEFPIYAAGHFWKRPGGDSWSLPLSVVGGIKGGLRADVHYGSAII